MGRAGTLTSAEDFRRTYAQGRRANAGAIVVFVRATSEERPARVGVSASRGMRGAVERNRVRRRLREAARILGDELRPGADIVLSGGSEVAGGSFQDMVSKVREALLRAGGCR